MSNRKLALLGSLFCTTLLLIPLIFSGFLLGHSITIENKTIWVKSVGVVSGHREIFKPNGIDILILIRFLDTNELATYQTNNQSIIFMSNIGIYVVATHDQKGTISHLEKWSTSVIKLEPELH